MSSGKSAGPGSAKPKSASIRSSAPCARIALTFTHVGSGITTGATGASASPFRGFRGAAAVSAATCFQRSRNMVS